MIWLMVALLGSLLALLLAAAGMVRHVMRQRAELRLRSNPLAGPPLSSAPHKAKEIDPESET